MLKTSISDGRGLTVDLLDYGARICNIELHGWQLSLAYDAIEDYQNDRFYLGASIGPIANRIAQGRLTIEGESLQMPCNEGDNCLHSGGAGFDKQTWRLESQSAHRVCYSLDYDMTLVGLKGRLSCKAIYRVVNNCLTVEYRTSCDTTSFINLTNHVYLNLSGTGNTPAGDISDHRFEINAVSYAVVDEHNLPTGELRPISSPFAYALDDSPYPEFIGQCDHYFNTGEPNISPDSGAISPVFSAVSRASGIQLEVSSNSSGLQFYSGKYLAEPFSPSGGFCVETQLAPDAINQAGFYSPLLVANQEQQQLTHFQFSLAK